MDNRLSFIVLALLGVVSVTSATALVFPVGAEQRSARTNPAGAALVPPGTIAAASVPPDLSATGTSPLLHQFADEQATHASPLQVDGSRDFSRGQGEPATEVAASGGRLDPFGFSENQYSSWGIVDAPYPFEGYDADGNYIDYGCFPVGNGLVFAHLGVDADFNTLRGITGPGYQTREDDGAWAVWKEGNWPDIPIRIYDRGSRGVYALISHKPGLQSIQQLRGAAMVRTVQQFPTFTLFCLTYAVPGQPLLIREFAVVPGDGFGDVVVALDLETGIRRGFSHVLENGPKRLTLTIDSPDMLLPGVFAATTRLDDSGVYRAAIAIQASYESSEPAGTALDLVSIRANRQATCDYWQEWSGHNLQFNTGDQRLDDMMAQLPVIIETERDYYSGGTSPMVSYHGYWVRDSMGPLLVDLANGRFENVLRMLRYHRACCLKYGSSHMLVPLDMDLSDLPGWKPEAGSGGTGGPPVASNSVGAEQRSARGGSAAIDDGPSVARPLQEPGGDAAPPQQQPYPTAGDLSGVGTAAEDWEGTPVEHAEVPSLIVLQHYLVWREMTAAGRGAEGDAFIREAWAFITHNLFAMDFHPDYGVYFHGDETYTQGALYSTYDREESGQIGYPNGYIPTQDYTSLDNTLLHKSAAQAAYFIYNSAIRNIEELGTNSDVTGEERQITELLNRMEETLHNFRGGGKFQPAIAAFTGQRCPGAFTNLSLAPWSLPLPQLGIDGEQYTQTKQQLHGHISEGDSRDSRIDWWSTPQSGYATGHALGTWLSAARCNSDLESAEELMSLLLQTATPEGAWCEVLNPDGFPVDIYGRTNRIRPWESGINYALISAYLLEQKQQQGMDLTDTEIDLLELYSLNKQQPPHNSVYEKSKRGNEWYRQGKYGAATEFPSLFGDEQLLVITKSSDWLDHARLDHRFAEFAVEQIVAWDAGLPFGIGDLGIALFFGSRDNQWENTYAETHSPSIPYLYFDRGVMGGLDRRTMKDHEFWYGEEMTKLLEDYEAAGGTVLYEDDLELRLLEDEAVALRLLVVLFPRTFCHEMDRAEQGQFQREVGKWVDWYDEVAGDRLRLELDYLQINTKLNPLQCGPQGDNVYWMGNADVEAMLRERGVADSMYDAVCCFWAWDRDAESLPGGETARQAYGGAAQGPGADMEFLGPAGRTGYFGSAVLASHQTRTGNNATHEFLHVLDAMFEMVGEPRLFHPDQMARNMDVLLGELPGAFVDLGYTDDEMRALAERELRKEDSFPWETQLVYYQQALQRIPRADYGKLLKRYGTRVERAGWKRFPLYEELSIPLFASAPMVSKVPPGTYIAIDNETGAYSVGNELNLVEDPDRNWQSGWAIGWRVLDDDYSFIEGVDVYREGEFTGPWEYELTLGEARPMLAAGLATTVNGYPVEAAEAWLEVDGERIEMENVGDNGYRCAIPEGLSGDFTATLHADVPGTVITPRPVHVTVKPPWELSCNVVPGPDGTEVLEVLLTAGPGGYTLELATDVPQNHVQQNLISEGLLNHYDLDVKLQLQPGVPLQFGQGDASFGYIHCENLTATVTSPAGVSYAHHFPATLHWSQLLLADPEELPRYIPRAQRITPFLDGMPVLEIEGPGIGPHGAASAESWDSSFDVWMLTDKGYGNAFSGSFDSADDCTVLVDIGYDDQYLYIAGQIDDDMTPGNGTWDSDRINLCFDAELNTTPATYPDGAVGHTGWERDDYWVFLNPCLPDGPQAMRLGGERPSGGKNGYYGPVADCKYAVIENERGYTFEWAIPWSSLPYLDPEPGSFTGFTFFYSDYDEGLSELMFVADWGGPGGIEWRFWDCGLLYFEE